MLSNASISRSPIPSLTVQKFIHWSTRLRRMLTPEDRLTSPYEILSYHSTLALEDGGGVIATFRRHQKIRFLQNGVTAILDHLWGDGVLVAGYTNGAGKLKDFFRDQNRHHLVIALERPMRRGDILEFDVKRTAMVGFTESEEW